MTGDMKKWRGSDLAEPAGESVKFNRQGGWFVSKVVLVAAAVAVLILLVLTALLTYYFTQLHLKDEEIQTQGINPLSYELFFNHSNTSYAGMMTMLFEAKRNLTELKLDYSALSAHSPILEYIGPRDEFVSSASNLEPFVPYSMGTNYSTVFMNITSFAYERKAKVITIETEKTLTPGVLYSLKIMFDGNMSREEKGIFKIPYKDSNATKSNKWVIGAFFSPMSSKVIPCIEDSSVRVPIRMKILRQANQPVVTNVHKSDLKKMPNSSALLEDFVWSPKIPLTSASYFILPDYKVKTVISSSPHLNIWYPSHLESLTKPVSEATTALLKFFETYIDTSLPLDRISIVIVDGLVGDLPAPFGIIPISSSMLYSPSYANYLRSEDLYYFLAKKIANQWIGNLVNLHSQSDYWIQEGLSLYLSKLAVSQELDDFKPNSFREKIQEVALHEGKFKNPKPNLNLIGVPQKKSAYMGAYVFNMISSVISEGNFMRGIQHFFKKWQSRSSDTQALWNSLSNGQKNINIPKFVESWSKNGYPVVTVSIENGQVIMEQAPVSDQSDSDLWQIPVFYSTDIDPDFVLEDIKFEMMDKKQMKLSLKNNETLILVNPSSIGFFRTNYSPGLWKNLTSALVQKGFVFPSTIQKELIDDAFSLASYGHLNYGVPLNITNLLRNETSYGSWTTAMKHLKYISLFMDDNKDKNNFQMFLKNLITNGLTFAKESEGTNDLTAKLNYWSCKFNISNDCNSTESGLEYLSLCSEIKSKKQNVSIGQVLALSRSNLAEPQKELSILRSLTCTSDKGILYKILDQSLNTSDPFFSPRRTVEIWNSLKETPSNSIIASDYTIDKFFSIFQKFRNDSQIMSAVMEGSTYALTKEFQYLKVMSLKETIADSPLLERILERVQFNVDWRKNHLPMVSNWLENWNKTRT